MFFKIIKNKNFILINNKFSIFISNILKVLRYFKLYGFRRTHIKIISRYHMMSKQSFEGDYYLNPNHSSIKQYVAIIGSGNFAFSNIAYFITKKKGNIIKYFYDIDKTKSLNASKYYKAKFASSDIKQILDDKEIKMVFIATNHSSHEYYASIFLKNNVDVHIEKPHVTTFNQLNSLTKNKKNNKIFLGFNRPKSYFFQFIKKLLDKERGPISLNWFILGHQIDLDHWYFFKNEGGRILGNFTHWTDLTFRIIGKEAFPCKIKCTDSKNSPSDFSFILQFANGSQASLMFSAKGEVFDGVRESLTLQKSNLFLKIDDFKNLTYQRKEKSFKKNLIYRDHGHEKNILNSLNGIYNKHNLGETNEYIYNTAYFFLKIKEAYENNKDILVTTQELFK